MPPNAIHWRHSPVGLTVRYIDDWMNPQFGLINQLPNVFLMGLRQEMLTWPVICYWKMFWLLVNLQFPFVFKMLSTGCLRYQVSIDSTMMRIKDRLSSSNTCVSCGVDFTALFGTIDLNRRSSVPRKGFRFSFFFSSRIYVVRSLS